MLLLPAQSSHTEGEGGGEGGGEELVQRERERATPMLLLCFGQVRTTTATCTQCYHTLAKTSSTWLVFFSTSW